MMAQNVILQEGEEEELFFDSRSDVSLESGSPAWNDSITEKEVYSFLFIEPHIEFCVRNLGTVRDRRKIFMRLMGLDVIRSPLFQSFDLDQELQLHREIQLDVDRVMSDSGAVLERITLEDKYLSSTWLSEDSNTSLDDGDNAAETCIVSGLGKDDSLRKLCEVGSNGTISVNEFRTCFGFLSLILRFIRREVYDLCNSGKSLRRTRFGWLKTLGASVHILDKEYKVSNSSICDSLLKGSACSGRVKVHHCRKKLKELSAIYRGQDIKAHDGAILTMKFSPDGKYLASGGEDGIVRVWHVMECEIRNDVGINKDDPSCIFFTINQNSELAPVIIDRKTKLQHVGVKRRKIPACVVLPSNIFRLSEKPVDEFRGHDGDVLDLSWSKNNFLLSSSTDKTVRLWKVGLEHCLQIFHHKNYVTCVQFNPVKEYFFMSGSIDGKIRIWEIPGCHVVDWLDIREIVTAICYHPAGKGAVVGTFDGICRFYEVSDHHLQLEARVSLPNKNKSLFKRITGLQFCPTNHRKLMVTSSDSKIRILDGFDVVSELKGFRNSRSQISASFTADGQHIVSASENSNVYFWNNTHDTPISSDMKDTRSYERFFSSSLLLAIPWHGLQSRDSSFGSFEIPDSIQDHLNDEAGNANYNSNINVEDLLSCTTLYQPPTGGFRSSCEFFSKVIPKGSATWPEEKLLSSAATSLHKPHCNFLKYFCHNTSHAWGQVIVTAGWDGWIRSYQNYGLPLNL